MFQVLQLSAYMQLRLYMQLPYEEQACSVALTDMYVVIPTCEVSWLQSSFYGVWRKSRHKTS